MTKSRTLPGFLTLQLLGWSGFFVAMAFSRLGRYPLGYMFAEKAWLTILGFGASLLLRDILRRLIRAEQSMAVLVAVCTIASYAISMVWTAIFNVGAVPIELAFLGRSGNINSLGALLSGGVYHSFAMVAWGFLYLGIKHHLALQESRERALLAETNLTAATLRALQYQLNPHLFFNTLNAISTLLVERRNDEAALMIAKLGDFMRTILRPDLPALVSLAEELTSAGQYLDIEQVRFGDRLAVSYDIDEEAYRGLVPRLLLQPLLENAIRHGVATSDARGTIELTGRRQGEMLEITVANSGTARGDDNGNGVGLANTRERLAVLYAERQQVRTTVLPDGRFSVQLRFPFVAQVSN